MTIEESYAAWLQSRILVKPTRPFSISETRVLDCLRRGWRTKEIASRLRQSPRTVEHHIEVMADLLPPDDCSPRDRLILWATINAAATLLDIPDAA